MRTNLVSLLARMKAITIISSLISLMAAGCETSPTGMSTSQPVAKERIVQLPVAHSEHPARVTIVRDEGLLYAAAPARLSLNGKPVATFRPRNSLTFSLDPGEYVFGLDAAAAINLFPQLREYSLNAKAGEHYYYLITAAAEGLILQRSYAVSQ
jgi:hypothetical protein